MTPEKVKSAGARGETRGNGVSLPGIGRYWIVCAGSAGQIKIGQDWMVRALQRWLDTHELPAIIAAVLGVVLALSILFVVGGYWLVTP